MYTPVILMEDNELDDGVCGESLGYVDHFVGAAGVR